MLQKPRHALPGPKAEEPWRIRAGCGRRRAPPLLAGVELIAQGVPTYHPVMTCGGVVVWALGCRYVPREGLDHMKSDGYESWSRRLHNPALTTFHLPHSSSLLTSQPAPSVQHQPIAPPQSDVGETSACWPARRVSAGGFLACVAVLALLLVLLRDATNAPSCLVQECPHSSIESFNRGPCLRPLQPPCLYPQVRDHHPTACTCTCRWCARARVQCRYNTRQPLPTLRHAPWRLALLFLRAGACEPGGLLE